MVSVNRGNHILELKKTPFSIGEGRFFVMKRAFPCIKETPPLFANNGFHSPLHSERGWGRGCRWAGGKLVVVWGIGCRGTGDRLLLSLKQQISAVNMIDF